MSKRKDSASGWLKAKSLTYLKANDGPTLYKELPAHLRKRCTQHSFNIMRWQVLNTARKKAEAPSLPVINGQGMESLNDRFQKVTDEIYAIMQEVGQIYLSCARLTTRG